MSKLSLGIVGLPNIGKSTLFNALLRKQQAYVANFPFATIEPNVGVVPVPDGRLLGLAEMMCELSVEHKKPPLAYATLEFVDIAGLIAGAHKGEGLGNKFLSHIREVTAVCHVVRDFESVDVAKEGSVNPVSDFEVIETELALADMSTLTKQQKPLGKVSKEGVERWNAVQKIRQAINNGKPARLVELSDGEMKQAKLLNLLTLKPVLVVVNISEADVSKVNEIESKYAAELGIATDEVIAICAKLEEEMASMSEQEMHEYLREFGVDKSGLERLAQRAFKMLDLMTFITIPMSADGPTKSGGVWEIKAWSVKNGTKAPAAAGEIHTDFESKFIKADVVSYEDIIENKGWKNCRSMGKVRQEGREYIVQEGDVIEFKIGT